MQLLQIGDGLSISAVEYASRANAILGIRDSGKTTTAKKIAEELFDAGIPFFAFDPSGRWRFMRSPAMVRSVGHAGREGRGFPVVVLGGAQPDLPLDPEKAHEVVRAAMRAGVSLVIDLYEKRLTKADWRKVVQTCVQTIFYENEEIGGLRHVFLEEAAEFVPQRPFDGRTYAEVEKLVRMGGNAGVGVTIINQRAEEVNKAVLELCDNLLLHRQRGKNSLLSLKKWLNAVEGDVADVTTTLAGLPAGECWAWFRDGGGPKRIHIAPLQSFHPDRRLMFSGKVAAARVDVSAFLKEMQRALDDKARRPAGTGRTQESKGLVATPADADPSSGKPTGAPAMPGDRPGSSRHQTKQEADVKESEARALRAENEQLKRTVAELEKKVRRLTGEGVHMAPSGNEVTTEHSTVRAFNGDFDDLYAAIKRRASADPGLLVLLTQKPEIEVRVERRTVRVDGATLKGRLAKLIASGFYDSPRSTNAVTNELKRTGGAGVNFGNLAREQKALAADGFLTLEADGYQAVDGMKVNLVEA